MWSRNWAPNEQEYRGLDSGRDQQLYAKVKCCDGEDYRILGYVGCRGLGRHRRTDTTFVGKSIILASVAPISANYRKVAMTGNRRLWVTLLGSKHDFVHRHKTVLRNKRRDRVKKKRTSLIHVP